MVAFGLTGEGEEDGAETPCSGLHSAPNRAQTKRLSQTYKSPKVKDSKGEQPERKKEEEEEGASGGLPKLRAPQAQGGKNGDGTAL